MIILGFCIYLLFSIWVIWDFERNSIINPLEVLQIKSMAHNHFNPVRVWPDYSARLAIIRAALTSASVV
jgi:hypothetical protein